MTEITPAVSDSPKEIAKKVHSFAKPSFAPKGGVSSTRSSWNNADIGDNDAVDDFAGDKGLVIKSPGKMNMSAKITLHTHLAINMFRGRKGDPKAGIRPIVGLARFARQVAQVWNASAEDDPYADLCLVEIESAFDTARELVESRELMLTELLTGMEDFTVETTKSTSPVDIPLDFFCPWGYRTALLLRQFDKLVRLGLTARRLGLMSADEWEKVVLGSGKSLRHVFAIVTRWVYTGVTRADMQRNSKVAQRASTKYINQQKTYTTIPDDVMSGYRRAILSPKNAALKISTV